MNRFCLFFIFLFHFSWCFSLVKDQDWTWDGNKLESPYFNYTPPFTSDEPSYSGSRLSESFVFMPSISSLSLSQTFHTVAFGIAGDSFSRANRESSHENSTSISIHTKSERLGEFINVHGYSIKYVTYQTHSTPEATATTGSIWLKKFNSDGTRNDAYVTFNLASNQENLLSETEIKELTDGLILKGGNGELLETNNNGGSGSLSSNDTNVFTPQTLNINEKWGWLKLPWIYVNESKDWIYYYNSGSIRLAYSNNYKAWYKWNDSTETWVLNN